MIDYLESIKSRDPAAKSLVSIILTYPGVKAVFFHKIGNFFFVAGFDLIARIISQTARFFTGIEICLLYTSPSPRDRSLSRMPSSA